MKPIPETEIVKQVEQRFSEILRSIPSAKITRSVPLVEKDDFSQAFHSAEIGLLSLTQFDYTFPCEWRRPDLVIEIDLAGRPKRLIFEVRASLEPREVRTSGHQLLDCLKRFSEAYGVLAAPYISDRSREICRELGIGCIDLAGNALLAFDQVSVDWRGYPNPYPERRRLKSVFSPRSSRVLRVLLSNPAKRWYVRDIALEARISLGQASDVKQVLLREEWLREEKKMFWPTKPEELLQEWAKNYDYRKNGLNWFYYGKSREEAEDAVGRQCEKLGVRCALALFSGANRIAAFVPSRRAFVFVERGLDEVANFMNLRRVDTGANVALLEPYDEGVFYGLQEVNGFKVVSDIQLYLDLNSYRGRGKEAAQAILEQRIRPKW